MRHTVTDIQRFCMHDGPGVRTTVFLKGCPLHCFWCHNPETQKEAPQLMHHPDNCIGCRACFACERGGHTEQNGQHHIAYEACVACGTCADICPTGALRMAGSIMESQEIIDIVLKDKAFYGNEGGLTVSGGEPMLHPEACIELLRLAKENGLHTAVETCGYFPTEYVKPLCEVTDVLLWDIKDTNHTRHKENTGVSTRQILQNLRLSDTLGVPIILRCVLLHGVNLTETHLQQVGQMYTSLANAIRVDLLPCHSLGNAKSRAMGAPVTDLLPYEPSQEEMDAATAILQPYLRTKKP